jgi:hypothetical protein
MAVPGSNELLKTGTLFKAEGFKIIKKLKEISYTAQFIR